MTTCVFLFLGKTLFRIFLSSCRAQVSIYSRGASLFWCPSYLSIAQETVLLFAAMQRFAILRLTVLRSALLYCTSRNIKRTKKTIAVSAINTLRVFKPLCRWVVPTRASGSFLPSSIHSFHSSSNTHVCTCTCTCTYTYTCTCPTL